MNAVMKISSNGLEKLSEWEGMKLHVYHDSAGKKTIGIGHLLTEKELTTWYTKIKGDYVQLYGGLTKQQALDLLDQDLNSFEAVVNKLVKVPLNQNQFDALVIFAFNIGVANFTTSSALRSVNIKQFSDVPRCMLKFDKIHNPKTGALEVCQGLVNRRNKEIKLFTSGG